MYIKDIRVQRFCLIVSTIHLQGHCQGAQSLFASGHIWNLTSFYLIEILAHAVEFYYLAMCTADKTVANGYLTARQTDDIYRVALIIVVVVVTLGSRYLHRILALNVEDGVSEGVVSVHGVSLTYRPVLLPDRTYQLYLGGSAVQVLCCIIAVAQIVESVVGNLLVTDVDRCMIDATVLGVILHLYLRDVLAALAAPLALNDVSVQRQ